ncbi:efflux transporter outer membrane subunit [Crenobacter sp. SG2303]|uniref:Efflux transporter outer membrane subunit n=1 Tax=Crenobacter oryzisoli TaxID=3056844 RepID=A0ABT7XN32_9NEIS|nr:efflux transporter outer membrane subunit [Crenobacter sp. SG2303]MDN0075195.1 efflux transporter outer membrane subunit [Crenobacter sp. SG2303]
MRVSILLVSVALAGCAAGPDFTPPAGPVTHSYLPGGQPGETVAAGGPGGVAQHFDTAADVPDQWWTLFRSPALDRLVRVALADSPTLAEARAKLVQAQQDYLAEAGATRYPSIDAGFGASRQKINTAAFGIPNAPNTSPFNLFNASVNVGYTLDLFGANRRALEGLLALVDYQRYELEAARLSLSANVVSAAIRRAALREEIVVTQSLYTAQQQQFDIMAARYRAGGIARLDLQNQQSLLAQTAAQLPPLQKQLALADHQLVVYLGKPPAEVELPELDLASLQLPAELPLTLPSSLARQRPDIRAAEALWHQASADVGVATANLYPKLTLSGSFGSERTRSGDVGNGVNVWSLGLNLMQPIFHGGELQAKRRSALAAYDASAAAYQQVVLQGLQQVADALGALDHDARTLQARANAADQADASYRISQQQYRAGGISQLALLDAQRQQLQTRLDRVQAEADRYTDSTALLQALGGGWWGRSTPP